MYLVATELILFPSPSCHLCNQILFLHPPPPIGFYAPSLLPLLLSGTFILLLISLPTSVLDSSIASLNYNYTIHPLCKTNQT